MHAHTRRSFRGLLIAAFATTAITLSGGTALGAHQVASTGSPGTWILPDTAANPAARCSYNGGGVLGGTYLTGIRQLNAVELFGTSSALRSAGRINARIRAGKSGCWAQTISSAWVLLSISSGLSCRAACHCAGL